MSPLVLVLAGGGCLICLAGLMVGAVMGVDLIVRWIDGRRHGP